MFDKNMDVFDKVYSNSIYFPDLIHIKEKQQEKIKDINGLYDSVQYYIEDIDELINSVMKNINISSDPKITEFWLNIRDSLFSIRNQFNKINP